MSDLWNITQMGGKCSSCGEYVEMKYSERPGWQRLAVGIVIGLLIGLVWRAI